MPYVLSSGRFLLKLDGGPEPQAVILEPGDLATIDGESLTSWDNVDLFSLRAYFEKDDTLLGSKSWAGPQPTFHNLRWE